MEFSCYVCVHVSGSGVIELGLVMFVPDSEVVMVIYIGAKKSNRIIVMKKNKISFPSNPFLQFFSVSFLRPSLHCFAFNNLCMRSVFFFSFFNKFFGNYVYSFKFIYFFEIGLIHRLSQERLIILVRSQVSTCLSKNVGVFCFFVGVCFTSVLAFSF